MKIYCDNNKCVWCNDAGNVIEEWECTYQGESMSFTATGDPVYEDEAVCCDNFKKKDYQ